MEKEINNIQESEVSSSSVGDVSIIYNNLKELQKVKISLQTHYDQLVEEQKISGDSVANARRIVSEIFATFMKTQESLNVTKMKLESLKARLQSSEHSCQILTDKVDDLQDKLRAEKQRQQDQLNNYEEENEELKKLFLDAIYFYTDENLDVLKAGLDGQEKDYLQKIRDVDLQLENAELELEKLDLGCLSVESWNQIISTDLGNSLLRMLSDEQCFVQHKIKHMEQSKLKIISNCEKQNCIPTDV